MNKFPFIIEKTFNAPIEKVWKAITDKNEMKQWYFNLATFEPKVGFEFKFKAGEVMQKKYYFAKESFSKGWTSIIGTSLQKFLKTTK